jgi:hypothetical protein
VGEEEEKGKKTENLSVPSSEMWRSVVWWKFAEVSEERTASIFRGKDQSKQAKIQLALKEWVSPLHGVQTDSGANPASYPMDTWGSFPGG